MVIKLVVKPRVSSFARNTENTLLLMLIFIVDINKVRDKIVNLSRLRQPAAATMNRPLNKRFPILEQWLRLRTCV